MTIMKRKFFIILNLLFLMSKIVSNSPKQNAELEFSFELENNKIIKVYIYNSSNSFSKNLKFYEQKNKDSLFYIGSMESISLAEGQFGEGFQEIYQSDNFLVIQQSFGDGKYLILSRLYFMYEKKRIRLVKYSEQQIDRFSENKNFTEIEYRMSKNIYINNITSDFVYELHKSLARGQGKI